MQIAGINSTVGRGSECRQWRRFARASCGGIAISSTRLQSPRPEGSCTRMLSNWAISRSLASAEKCSRRKGAGTTPPRGLPSTCSLFIKLFASSATQERPPRPYLGRERAEGFASSNWWTRRADGKWQSRWIGSELD